METKKSKTKVTVYTARKVRTMDPGRPEVESVAKIWGGNWMRVMKKVCG